ncbi:MAG: SRPBCC family protein [Candidatus Acidiferrales bacterium]
MNNTQKLKITTPTEREIAIARTFDAPRHRVFDGLTQPGLVKQWLLGPPGWSMPICKIDLKVGGAYRFQWSGPNGAGMGTRGVYREIAPPERLVATERFDEPWYPGEAIITYDLLEQDGKTTLTLTIFYESRGARDAVLKTPMEQGIAASYDNLAKLLAQIA